MNASKNVQIDRAMEIICRSVPDVANDASAQLIIRENLAWIWDRSGASAALVIPAVGKAQRTIVASAADLCDNCLNAVEYGIDVYGDAGTIVCSEKCYLELKAQDHERWTAREM